MSILLYLWTFSSLFDYFSIHEYECIACTKNYSRKIDKKFRTWWNFTELFTALSEPLKTRIYANKHFFLLVCSLLFMGYSVHRPMQIFSVHLREKNYSLELILKKRFPVVKFSALIFSLPNEMVIVKNLETEIIYVFRRCWISFTIDFFEHWPSPRAPQKNKWKRN